MRNRPEVLAPCGDMESLKVAVNNGADAVYCGLSRFNARMRATNFGIDLQEAVNYCHLFGTKVYITVNTLIKDEEVQDFLQSIDEAVSCGIDAVIVQDFGMAHLLHQLYPNLELHASTQMGIHNVEGAKFLEQLGFSRVVLSRETRLEDIKAIRQNTSLEIEYFVQGALCVAFSGNCLFSWDAYDKSGNRGECKQLCRMCYGAKCDKQSLGEGYYLSPADLSLIDRVQQLAEAGVSSFKIEGRLRRPGYVATMTHWYRKAVDELGYAKIDQKELSVAFTRGEFNTKAYLTDHKNIIQPVYNNHSGVAIGEVVWVKPFKDLYRVAIKTKQSLHQGDGLKIYRNNKEVASLGVGNVEYSQDLVVVYTKQKVQPKDDVHLILDKQMEDHYCTTTRTVLVDMSASIRLWRQPTLTLKAQDVQVVVFLDDVVQESVNKTLTKDEVYTQLTKLKDTSFCLGQCDILLDNDCFLSKSMLNELRRKGVEQLTNAILNNKKPTIVKQSYTLPTSKKVVIPWDTMMIANEETMGSADLVIIAPKQYCARSIELIQSKCKAKAYYLQLPVVANHKDMVVLDSLLQQCHLDGVVIDNYYGAKYITDYPFVVGPRLNVYNTIARDVWYALGAKLVIGSYEQTLDQTASIEGRVPLMVLCHCPYQVVYQKDCKECPYTEGLTYTLQQHTYPIRRYQVAGCYFELLSDKIRKGKTSYTIMDQRQ